jgi:hypothetical protein
LASTTFWFFQITIHTLAAIVMPSTMPTRMDAFWETVSTRATPLSAADMKNFM